MSGWSSRSRSGRRLIVIGVSAGALALATAATALGGLVGGSLPTAGYTYTSGTINDVNMADSGIHLKTKGAIDVKSTFSRLASSEAFVGGWHHHNGPVIVTVTTGVLTFFGSDCETWDVAAGETYIETVGQVLNAKVLPAKNAGISTVEWFTTRLYPDGAADPVPEATAPCVP